MKRLTALVLALGLLMGLASGPLAPPTRAASLKVCGEVTLYVKPTLLGTGLLTVNAIPLVIAAGVDLPASVQVGADLCLDLTTNALGLITGAAVTANVHTKLKLCGTVTAYAEATASATGLLKIGGKTLTLGVGSDLPASVDVGADLCLDLELDAFGRVSDGTVEANVETQVKICGKVTAYAEATASSVGSLTIGGQTFKVAVDEDLPAMVDVDADLCLDLTLNGFGQISRAGAVANIETTLDVCGKVTAYAAATSNNNGAITIGGVSKVIASGADVDGDVEAQAYLKLRLRIDAFGRVSRATVLKVATSVDDACGTASGTPDPNPSQGPNPTQQPGSTPNPNPTQGPSASSDPGASPGASPSPGASNGPDPSAQPSQDAGGITDDCTTGSTSADAGGHGNGSLLPDTDSIGRAAGVVVTNAIPLIAIGLLGGLAYWYRARRNPGSELDLQTPPALAVDSPIDTTVTDEVGA
jgi:hypothetical protein